MHKLNLWWYHTPFLHRIRTASLVQKTFNWQAAYSRYLQYEHIHMNFHSASTNYISQKIFLDYIITHYNINVQKYI